MRFSRYMVVMLFLWANVSIGQESNSNSNLTTSVDINSYEEIRNELDFTKTKRALKKRESKKRDKKAKEKKKKRNPISFPGFQGSGIIQILAYLLIIGLVCFIIFIIFSKIEIDKNFELSGKDKFTDEIEDIKDLDTISLLEQALAKEDYRAAVRIKFLDALKTLSIQEKIIWKKEKTNRDYSRELRKESFGGSFQNLAYIFDHVWYGKTQILKERYQIIDSEFISFSKQLNG